MPYDPSTFLIIRVEIYINGTWIEVTSRSRGAEGVRIKVGRSAGARYSEASALVISVGNIDGWLTEGNPLSPWYPYIGRGTPIRVSLVEILASAAQRFSGTIDNLRALHPGGRNGARVRIVASGTFAPLGSNDDPEQSAMYRTMIGKTSAGYSTHAYWAMQDGAEADRIASSLPGQSSVLVAAGTMTTASDDTMAGSLPLPVLSDGAALAFAVAAYTDGGVWGVQVAFRLYTSDSWLGTYVDLDNGYRVRVDVVDAGGGSLLMAVFDTTGTLVDTDTDTFVLADTVGVWRSLVIGGKDLGGGSDAVYARFMDDAGADIASVSVSNPGAYDTVGKVTVGVATDQVSIGHLGVTVDSGFDPETDGVEGAKAMAAWVGEAASDRLGRVCTEEDRAYTLVGTSTVLMGPQQPGSLLALLRTVEEVDEGQLSDTGTDGAVRYVCRSSIYNASAAVAVTKGALTKDTVPIWDLFATRNDWTVSRPQGSTIRRDDSNHVALIQRRLRDRVEVNVYADSQLPDQAGWRVLLGTAPGPRFEILGINLRDNDGAELADNILALGLGGRITAAAETWPGDDMPYGVDLIVIGWSEIIDVDKWEIRFVCLPYSPYAVGIAGDGSNAAAWAQTSSGTKLAAELSATGTALSVTVDGPLFSTSASLATHPLSLLVGGEVMPVTSISGASSPQTINVTRTLVKTHPINTPVRIYRPLVATL